MARDPAKRQAARERYEAAHRVDRRDAKAAWYRAQPSAYKLRKLYAYRRRRVTRILDRDGWVCAYCAAPLTAETATRDHKLPISRGGTDDDRNVVAACLRDNQRKHMKTYAEYRRQLRAEAEAARRMADPDAPPEWVTAADPLAEDDADELLIVATP